MRSLLFLLLLCFSATAYAQDPVSWNFSSKKINNDTYEIHMTAALSDPWHIYSQSSPEGGSLPTSITFAKNPLLTLDGKVKENGQMKSHFEKVFDVTVKYYENNVNFVQTVKLKTKAKTKISGSIVYMVCTASECKPEATENFTLALP